MNNYKIILQYDGTRYRGWQSLGDTEQTIQGKLQNVLARLNGGPVAVIGSGRTDAGVHASGQTANFCLSEAWEEDVLRAELNRYLPEDIAVLRAERVGERFHSRYQARSKTYLYRIDTGEVADVFKRRYVYHYPIALDVRRMRRAADLLIGTHDFRSFCGNKKMKKSTVRTLSEITIAKKEQELQIFYTGNGFLQNMVRILTGTLIEIGDGRRQPEEIEKILAAKERACAGYTAPACGLTLLEVTYGEEEAWKNGS